MPRIFAVAALLSLFAMPAVAGKPASTPQVSTVPDTGFKPLVEAPLELDDTARRYLLWYARQACGGGGGMAAMVPPPSLTDARRPIIVTLFHAARGERRVRRRVDGDAPLVDKLRQVMPEICSGLDQAGVAAHLIHVMVVTRTVRMPNFGFKGLFTNKVFEPQVMGLAYEHEGTRTERDPIESVMYNHGPKSLRRAMMKDLGFEPLRFGQLDDLTIEMYEVDHFGEGADGQFVSYFRGYERLTPEDVTPALLLERIRLIGEWYRNNVRDDGQVTYEFSPSKRTEADAKRTMVRSTMAVWVLNRLAVFLDDADLLDKGEEGIEYYLDRYFQIDQSRSAGRIVPSPRPIANGNLVENRYTVASFIAGAIMERPDWKEHATDVDLLMTYAMSKMKPDGLMWSQFANSQYFMPGQLLLIVSYAAAKTGEAKYTAFFDKALATYGPALEGQMALAPPLWVPYAPAWYTQPFVHRWLQAKSDRLKQLVFGINDRVVRHHRYNADHQRHYDYDGAMTPKRGYYGNNSVTAASLEALADAAILAKAAGDMERFGRYQTAIRHITAYLLRLQFTPNNAYWVRDKERVIGGFKTDLIKQDVWMDNVWHLTSAFIKIHRNGLLD